ncbi:unnamed protein product, partial [Dovyalis caffra]
MTTRETKKDDEEKQILMQDYKVEEEPKAWKNEPRVGRSSEEAHMRDESTSMLHVHMPMEDTTKHCIALIDKQ